MNGLNCMYLKRFSQQDTSNSLKKLFHLASGILFDFRSHRIFLNANYELKLYTHCLTPQTYIQHSYTQ